MMTYDEYVGIQLIFMDILNGQIPRDLINKDGTTNRQ